MKFLIILIALALLCTGAEAKYSPGLEIASGGNVTLQNGYLVGWNGWQPAGETWTYRAAATDDPTYGFNISGDKTSKYGLGDKINLTQTTVKYFIITKISYSSPNTMVTMYGGTDYDLANAAITNSFFSKAKSPAGFPFSSSKWTVYIEDLGDYYQTNPVSGTWYNLGTLYLDVPIGVWYLGYNAILDGENATTAMTLNSKVTLSTSTSSATDSRFIYRSLVGPMKQDYHRVDISNYIELTSKTRYYLIERAFTGMSKIAIYSATGEVPIRIEATTAYL